MSLNENKNRNVPESHPRYSSLKYRHKIIEGMKNLVVAEAGLIAHGRGECFDYIIGEKTTKTAKNAIKVMFPIQSPQPARLPSFLKPSPDSRKSCCAHSITPDQ